jgi:HEAT repeat protein
VGAAPDSADASANAAANAGANPSSEDETVVEGPSQPTEEEPSRSVAPEKAAVKTVEEQRLDTIRYGTETEIAALIQTLKSEDAHYLDDELVRLVQNTRNRSILAGVFSFFGDRGKEGLEDRALRALEDRDDEANETIIAAIDYLGKVRSEAAIGPLQELLDAEERRFMNAAFRALGRAGGGLMEKASPAAEGTVGEGSLGEGSLGEGTVGETAVGETAIGEGAVGETAVGEVAIGGFADANSASPDSNAPVDDSNAPVDETADTPVAAAGEPGSAGGESVDADETAGPLAAGTPDDSAADPALDGNVSGGEGPAGGGKPAGPESGGSRDEYGRRAAAVAEYLVDYYTGRDPGDENLREIVIALGTIGSAAGVDFLKDIAGNNDERGTLRMAALESLAKIGDPAGLETVLEGVSSSDPNVRSSAVAALGPFSGDAVDQAIMESFRDSYYRTRIAAAQAARERKLESAIPYLQYRAERDEVPAVKDEAIRALGAIGSDEALEILADLFGERKNADRVRLLAAEMLIQNKGDTYAGKVIVELDEAKQKNLTPLYNGFLRVLGAAKTQTIEDLARRFFFSGGVVEKSYALDMTVNNEFRSLADQVRELTDEKNGSLARKARTVLEKLGLNRDEG